MTSAQREGSPLVRFAFAVIVCTWMGTIVGHSIGNESGLDMVGLIVGAIAANMVTPIVLLIVLRKLNVVSAAGYILCLSLLLLLLFLIASSCTYFGLVLAAAPIAVGYAAVAFPPTIVPEHPCCLTCGYRLSGISSTLCPECGEDIEALIERGSGFSNRWGRELRVVEKICLLMAAVVFLSAVAVLFLDRFGVIE